MPELPDVEIFREYFQATALRQEIAGVEIESAELLEEISKKRLTEKLTGGTFRSVTRHGKYLFAALAKGWLVLHFGMTGFLQYFKNLEQRTDHTRLLVKFTTGYRLAWDCQRKFGQIHWTDDQEKFVAEKQLGPDPLDPDFDQAAFMRLLEKRRGSIKSLLMNQQILAGLGNVYSDEILFQAGVHPRRQVADLQEKERKQLFEKLGQVLSIAIERRVGEKGWPEDWLLPCREPGKDCPICGGDIAHLKISGRSAYFCGEHQRSS